MRPDAHNYRRWQRTVDSFMDELALSRRQLDRLGDRLRDADVPLNEDLETLSIYQSSLEALRVQAEVVVVRACMAAGLEGQFDTSSRTKQVRSIVAKLRREPVRLGAMQDLVGSRFVVPNALAQQHVLDALTLDEEWRLKDRRMGSVHGYRAIHLIHRDGWRTIEVQLRTALQHAWAGLSEHWDFRSPGIKYGQGDAQVLRTLQELSTIVGIIEQVELGTSPPRKEQLESTRGYILGLMDRAATRRDEL